MLHNTTTINVMKWTMFLFILIALPAVHQPAHAQISHLVPDDNTTDVPLNTKVLVTFDRAMRASSITTSTFTIDNSTTFNVSYSADYKTAILTPTVNLNSGVNYICTLTTGLRDASGNQVLSHNVSWNFTTGSSTRTTDLEVSSVSPADGANDTSRTPEISAVFKTFINPVTLTVSAFHLEGINGTISYDPGLKKAVFLLNQELNEEKTYKGVVTTAVQDIYGNNLAAEYTWSFTTTSDGGCFIKSLK